VKWVDGEPMSLQDLERVVKVFELKPLQTQQPDPGTMSGFQMRLRDSLRKYFENK